MLLRAALMSERCFACVLFPGLCVMLIALLGGADAEAKGYASTAGIDTTARSECAATARVCGHCLACVLHGCVCVCCWLLIAGCSGVVAKGYASTAGKDINARSECCYLLH